MSSTASELSTITSSLEELSRRLSSLVESPDSPLESEVYAELVAAERTVGTLLRRLQRISRRTRS
jgi:hypothetical protein